MSQPRPPIKIDILRCASMRSSFVDQSDEIVGATYNGIKANSSGIHCLSITKSGNQRGTNIELGAVQEIVVGRRVYRQSNLRRRWQQIAAEIGGFVEDMQPEEWADANLDKFDNEQYKYSTKRDAESAAGSNARVDAVVENVQPVTIRRAAVQPEGILKRLLAKLFG